MISMGICLLLLLLLPYGNGTALKKSPKKRSTNDSFNVNIGAGYGVGIDQNTPFLPESTTQINSTNPLTSILKNEHVIIGKYPGKLPNFDSKMVESQIVPVTKMKENVEHKQSIVDMKEIRSILHNVNDNSEYSKIVQVVKVPAVYEIHLEKVEKNYQPQSQQQYHQQKQPHQQLHHQQQPHQQQPHQQQQHQQQHHQQQHHQQQHQQSPIQYIQQINNLVKRPKIKEKKKILMKVTKPNSIVYGSKNKDLVKIDDWQINNQIRKGKHNHNNNYKNVHNEPHINPTLEGNTKPIFREKKNTNFQHNNPPQNHQNYYRPQYTPYHPPVPQKHSVYSTLTRKVPFTVRKDFSHRSEIPEADLIYGNNKEQVLKPDDINITIQPGTTMVTVPKLERKAEENGSKGCMKDYGQPELNLPPEMTQISSNIDHIYFTTLKPPEKENDSNKRSWPREMGMEKRSGLRPFKYMLYINKIVTEDW